MAPDHRTRAANRLITISDQRSSLSTPLTMRTASPRRLGCPLGPVLVNPMPTLLALRSMASNAGQLQLSQSQLSARYYVAGMRAINVRARQDQPRIRSAATVIGCRAGTDRHPHHSPVCGRGDAAASGASRTGPSPSVFVGVNASHAIKEYSHISPLKRCNRTDWIG